MATPSFREQVLQVRERAIVESVNRLLAEKGYDAMTVDEVAADVGIAKASLYKHFDSKEALAAAAMVALLDRTLELVAGLKAQADAAGAKQALRPIDQLERVVRWTLQVQLAGEMPALPAQNSALRKALGAHAGYLDRLIRVSEELGAWITAAQKSGDLSRSLPPEMILYTLFARACDPVLGVLKAVGQHRDEDIVEWLVQTTFHGLGGQPSASAAKANLARSKAGAGRTKAAAKASAKPAPEAARKSTAKPNAKPVASRRKP